MLLQEQQKLLGYDLKSIAVFRALNLSDMFSAVPAFRALRHAYPDAELTLIGLPWAKDFAERFSHIFKNFIPCPYSNSSSLAEFLAATNDRQFDALIQMNGCDPSVNFLYERLNVKHMAGFYKHGEFYPCEHLFMPYPERAHQVVQYMHLMEFLGIPSRGLYLEFPLSAKDFQDLNSIEGAEQLGSDYVCLHLGSTLSTHGWLPQHFARVGDQLSALGCKVVLTGTQQDESLARSVGSLMNAPHVNLVNKTTLGALGALLKRARLLICNGRGMSYMASALKVPSITVITDSDFNRWAPMDQYLNRLLFVPKDPQMAAQMVAETSLKTLNRTFEWKF